MNRRVIIVGAGPAGLMAAGKAGERGCDTILAEKNDRVGKKLLISGKGRCNITNSTDVEGLIENTPGNGSFLYSAFYTFSNWDLISFFNEHGLETKVERGGRVFPLSDKSSDVVETLMRYVRKNNVKLFLKSPVQDIKVKDNKVKSVVFADGREIECDSVVLATGGVSYPGTGSTGDGHRIAKSLGHTIVDLKPSLVPLVTEEQWVKELQGLSLRNVSVTLLNKNGKKDYK